jgi:hypothetical protein
VSRSSSSNPALMSPSDFGSVGSPFASACEGELERARWTKKPRFTRSLNEMDSFARQWNNEGTKKTFHDRRFGEGSGQDE